MVSVKKPDYSVHLCIDYRRINSITTPDPFQIPLIEDIVVWIALVKRNTFLSLMWTKGFQIPVAEKDQDKPTTRISSRKDYNSGAWMVC